MAAATALAFAPVLRNGFTNYDDGVYVTENPAVQEGFTASSLRWAWTTYHEGNWHPLTWISHMLDCRLFGLEPAGHHATSLLLHALGSVLLFLALTRMTGLPGRSGAVAGLFALHPLHVESVAWVAERKDVLSGVFWMLALMAYTWHCERPSRMRLGVVSVAFALGLTAKPMVVTLPVVLLLLDAWPLRRDWPVARLIAEKVPLLVLSAGSATVTVLAQRAGDTVASLHAIPFQARLENAVYSTVAYLGKLVWPHNLAVFYPHPGLGLSPWKTWGAALVVVAISWIAFRLRRRAPYLGVGWAWYLVTVLPVLGLLQVGGQGMADRYTYLPSIGLFLAAVWGGADLVHVVAGPDRRWARTVAATACVLLLALLGGLTRAQARTWRSSITLFEHALVVTRENYIAHLQLATALSAEGRNEEAIAQLREMLRITPQDSGGHFNLAVLLEVTGRTEEAQQHYLAAIDIVPRHAVSHLSLGRALAQAGRYPEASEHFAKAAQMDPGLAAAYYNWGTALAAQQDWTEAVARLRRAVEVQPHYPEAHHNLGAALYFAGHYQEARHELQTAQEQGYPPNPELLRRIQARLPGGSPH